MTAARYHLTRSRGKALCDTAEICSPYRVRSDFKCQQSNNNVGPPVFGVTALNKHIPSQVTTSPLNHLNLVKGYIQTLPVTPRLSTPSPGLASPRLPIPPPLRLPSAQSLYLPPLRPSASAIGARRGEQSAVAGATRAPVI